MEMEAEAARGGWWSRGGGWWACRGQTWGEAWRRRKKKREKNN